ncbi:MAG: acetyl-CoA carboxylase biotin carboxyl carrier protein [Candidatus Marinimicrobia bacterium]|nr:acetyl-CoA carboxylase biotin carboxyl carrier protein [Candidatus Neomarinimicrobiota bacterium]
MWQDKLKEIIYILEHSDVNEIDVTFLGKRYRVVKSAPVSTDSPDQKTHSAPATVSTTESSPIETETPVADETVAGNEVLSPMPGTFYSSPSPEEDTFVNEGDKVNKGDTLCIIEAMKIMNEIEAEEGGVVRKILVENADPVEYNQPLFIIDPSG